MAASFTPLSRSTLFLCNNPSTTKIWNMLSSSSPSIRFPSFRSLTSSMPTSLTLEPRTRRMMILRVADTASEVKDEEEEEEEAEKPKKKKYPGEAKGFVEEMRFVAMRLHTRDQAKEGQKQVKEPQEGPVAKWEPSLFGYLSFLVDSKLVYDTLESIVDEATVPYYAEFRNTGLERSGKLAKDLERFKEQGHTIPEPSEPGLAYSRYLEELSLKDPQAFICHFYNVYFAHSAGGRMIGKKVAEMLQLKEELEFYKWDGDLSELLQNVREKLNKVAQGWTREEKDHCLEETEKSFKYSGDILRLILS